MKHRRRNPSKLFLTVKDLERLVPLSRAGVYRLARKLGKRVGRRLLIPRVRFERWVTSESS